MKRAIPVICAALCAILPVRGSATDDESPVGGVVTRIDVEGLRRTREQTVLRMIPLSPGDVVDPRALLETRQALLRSNLFSEIEVYASSDTPSTTVLYVDVVEKWSVIPIPFLAVGNEGLGGGAMLMDGNFLGRNKQLTVFGFANDEGVRGAFRYGDPSIAGSSFSASTMVRTGASEVDIETIHGDSVRTYDSEDFTVGFGVGYRATRHIRIQADTSVLNYGLYNVRGEVGDLAADGVVVTQQIGVNVESVHRTPLFSHGWSTGITASIDTTTWLPAFDAKGELSTLFGRRTRGAISSSAGIGDRSLLAERKIGGRAGARTLPQRTVAADDYANVSASIEYAILESRPFFVTASPFLESGAYRATGVDWTPYYGVGIATRLMLRRIMIPAIGIEVGYNATIGTPVVMASLGFAY